MNFLSADKTTCINSYGVHFTVGDIVKHDGADPDETAVINSFDIDDNTVEVRAHTTRGHCHVDFIYREVLTEKYDRELPETD